MTFGIFLGVVQVLIHLSWIGLRGMGGMQEGMKMKIVVLESSFVAETL